MRGAKAVLAALAVAWTMVVAPAGASLGPVAGPAAGPTAGPTAGPAVADPVPEALASPCPTRAVVQNLGTACRTPGGLLEVFDRDGRSLGTTHGVDPAPPSASTSASTSAGADAAPPDTASATTSSSTGVRCIDDPYATGGYGTVVIYARAHDDADRYDDLVDDVRALTVGANDLVDAAAAATGADGAKLRVECSGGQVVVREAVLPTDKAAASFSTIVEDLEDAGYDSGRVQHWVFYDDRGACTCGGTGHVHDDDRMASFNANNGEEDPTFAVNFGYASSTRIWLHELGHNMGAVQDSAPHSTLAHHCTDGLDIMCYDDGGPRSHEYTTDACASQVWDCGRDDYFRADPAVGAYLDAHWNLAAPFHRFVEVLHDTSTELVAPVPNRAYAGCTADAPVPLDVRPDPTYALRGCVRIEASNPAGIDRVDVYFRGDLVGNASGPVSGDLYEIEWAVQQRGAGVVRVQVHAGDGEVVNHWETVTALA